MIEIASGTGTDDTVIEIERGKGDILTEIETLIEGLPIPVAVAEDETTTITGPLGGTTAGIAHALENTAIRGGMSFHTTPQRGRMNTVVGRLLPPEDP